MTVGGGLRGSRFPGSAPRGPLACLASRAVLPSRSTVRAARSPALAALGVTVLLAVLAATALAGGRLLPAAAAVAGCDVVVTGAATRGQSGPAGTVSGGVAGAGRGGCAEGETAAVDPVWDRLAHCESSGDWAIDTGNGYHGGLQFDDATWRQYGGTEFAPQAHRATREQQVAVATRVRNDRGGYGSWPACANELGLPR